MRLKNLEQAMANETPLQTVETGDNGEAVAEDLTVAEEQEVATTLGAAQGRPESSTKGMLREAIQKVMKEIEHHEREAKKHLQHAKALRKDLRDSFAFLQERKEDDGVTGETRSINDAAR